LHCPISLPNRIATSGSRESSQSSIISIDLSTEDDWTVTKVLIINEISMAGIDMFSKLDKHLQILTGNRHLLYGGIHILCTGDVMQLAPVGDHLSSANL